MLLVRNATLITMAPGQEMPFQGWFTVGEDGRIVQVGAGEAPGGADQVLDLDGMLVAPDFVSAHSHLSTSGSRGLGHDRPLYGWNDAMTRYTRHCDAEDIYWATLHGALDLLNNGVTTACDFTDGRLPFAPLVRGQRIGGGAPKPLAYATAQIDAKVEAGLRFVNSTLLDETVGTADEVLERFGQVVAHAERYRGGGQCLRLAISGAVQWSPSPEIAALEVEAMRRFGVMNQPHFLETAEETELQHSKFAWYRDAGAFGTDLVFGHFVQATDAMIHEAARCRCGMSWQPTANGRLASGAARVRTCLNAGMRVGVGVDDQSCTDLSDPWQNMRMGIYIQRTLARDPAAMGVAEMLRLHTLGSADVLGIADQVGSLAPGRFADFLVVDPRSPDTGPVWDPVATYVLACSLRNLKAVYVGGRRVSEDGRSDHPLAVETSRQLHARLRRIAARVDAQEV